MSIKINPIPGLVLSREQVRDVDRRAIDDYGMTGLVLMENAGRNAAEHLVSLGIKDRVVICCGKGNNAGDGFVIARHLENRGISVKVLLVLPASELTGDAAANFRILEKASTSMSVPTKGDSAEHVNEVWPAELDQANWVVDALLGTGLQGNVREPFLSAITTINSANSRVFSVDIPSGMDCNTGEELGACVRAEHTATFVARKPGFDAPFAQRLTGKIQVLDIGVPHRLIRQLASGQDF